MLWLDQPQESRLRIQIRGDDVGAEFVAVLQYHTRGAPIADQDSVHRRVHADFHPWLRADAAIASETAPMPPATNPQSPRFPATPPMQ